MRGRSWRKRGAAALAIVAAALGGAIAVHVATDRCHIFAKGFPLCGL